MLAWMKEILNAFLNVIIHVLPTSPFRSFIVSLEQLPFLGYLNWFVPVGQMLTIGTAWLVAIGAYYLWSVIARWVKLIE